MESWETCYSTSDLLLLNARSVNNKTNLICYLLVDEYADLACIAETWLSKEGGVLLSELCPLGFKIQQQSKLGG